LDTEEDYLHQITGNILAQATGSSGAPAVGNIPGQNTGSSGAQATGSIEARMAESSEVATTVVTVECTSAHAVVYPNSDAVNPILIIENNN